MKVNSSHLIFFPRADIIFIGGTSSVGCCKTKRKTVRFQACRKYWIQYNISHIKCFILDSWIHHIKTTLTRNEFYISLEWQASHTDKDYWNESRCPHCPGSKGQNIRRMNVAQVVNQIQLQQGATVPGPSPNGEQHFKTIRV